MVRGLLALTLLTMAAMAATNGERPRCTAALQATFWPLEANTDPKLARQLARDGVLEMCSLGWMRYHWRAVTVNAKRAAEKARAAEEKQARAETKLRR